MKLIFWCKDEFSKGWMDKDNFVNRLTGNKTGYGNFDKLAHFILHVFIVELTVIHFHRHIWIGMIASLIFGILWGIIKDCLISKSGLSKYDFFSNVLGMLVSSLNLYIGGYR